MCDILDGDDDGDSWTDSAEMDCGTDSLDSLSIPDDLDGDWICDDWDDDADGDGLPNEWELERGFDPLDSEDFMTCHGISVFCLRTYDDFTFAETHNAYSTIEDQILVGVNHYTCHILTFVDPSRLESLLLLTPLAYNPYFC